MKGDFSRSTFDAKKHYNGVRMQQGRVQLDADWNEQIDVAAHRTQTEAIDTIGQSGAPMHNAGFLLTDGAVPKIKAGHYYVDGILCENDADIDINKQPDLPGFTLGNQPGYYLAYLDVWRRHITALEDADIREVALGGPDTATRTKTVWQVKLIGPLTTSLNCASEPADWLNLFVANRGKMKAQAEASSLGEGPCVVPPGAKYRRLENQLYRVEIHQAGNLGTAKFKWSRDNGSIVTKWTDQKGSDLIVSSIGRDKVLCFAAGQTVEVTDDTRDLKGEAGMLVHLGNAEGQVLTLDPLDPATATIDINNFRNNSKVRRWDSDGAIATSATWTLLEDGVQVAFSPGYYAVGDYWLIPARTAKGDIEWPVDDSTPPQAVFKPREGIEHHYARLAILYRDTGSFHVTDCRNLFPPQTELTRFFYVGGDGQEAMPGDHLPQPLQVGVMNGPQPVKNAKVRFTAADVSGKVALSDSALTSPGTTNSVIAFTDPNGVAACYWLPVNDVSKTSQKVEAVLLDVAGNPSTLTPIRFSANLSIARQVAYDPLDCSDLAGKTNVQDAIYALCQRKPKGGCCVTVGEGGEFETLDEAIEKLLAQKRYGICICLLPGEHRTPNGLSLEWDVKRSPLHLSIHGCAGARIIAEKPWRFEGLTAFALRDIEFIAPAVELGGAFVTLVGCAEVAVTSCQMAAKTIVGALLGVARGDHLSLVDNVIEAYAENAWGLPQQLANGTPLEGIFDIVSRRDFLYEATRLSEEKVTVMSEDERKALIDKMQKELVENKDQLTPVQMKAYVRFASAFLAKAVNPAVLGRALLDIRDATAKSAPGLAVVVADGQAETILQGNHVLGTVGLYGAPGEPASGEAMVSLLQKLAAAKVNISGLGRTLHVRGNRLSRMAVGEQMLRRIGEVVAASATTTPGALAYDASRLVMEVANLGTARVIGGIYNTAFISDNLFEAESNQWLGEHLSFTSNSFEPVSGYFIGAVVGDTAIFTGNRSTGERARLIHLTAASQEAANLRVTIAEI